MLVQAMKTWILFTRQLKMRLWSATDVFMVNLRFTDFSYVFLTEQNPCVAIAHPFSSSFKIQNSTSCIMPGTAYTRIRSRNFGLSWCGNWQPE
jgi:hypothetical protein